MTETQPSNRGDARGERAAARRSRRLDDIRDATEALFIRKGVDTVSMDDVAEVAVVSKATLYKYFRSKNELLTAVVTAWIGRANARLMDFDTDGDIRDVLHKVGENFDAVFISEDSLAFRRMVIAALARHPEIEQLVIDGGPTVFIGRLADYFAAQVARGAVRMADPWMAAEQFHAVLNGNVGMSGAMLVAKPSLETRRRRLDLAVDMFVTYYTSGRGSAESGA